MASGQVCRAQSRTHGCSEQSSNVKILLANPEPSTHGLLQDVQFTLNDLTVQAA
jgi:hypothetical protein